MGLCLCLRGLHTYTWFTCILHCVFCIMHTTKQRGKGLHLIQTLYEYSLHAEASALFIYEIVTSFTEELSRSLTPTDTSNILACAEKNDNGRKLLFEMMLNLANKRNFAENPMNKNAWALTIVAILGCPLRNVCRYCITWLAHIVGSNSVWKHLHFISYKHCVCVCYE